MNSLTANIVHESTPGDEYRDSASPNNAKTVENAYTDERRSTMEEQMEKDCEQFGDFYLTTESKEKFKAAASARLADDQD